MAFSLTVREVAYHWSRSSSTDVEPATVSSDDSSWGMSGFTSRSEDRANEALT